MNSKKALFVFTKDRPSSLDATIHSLREINLPVYVVDDSFYQKYQEENKLISKDRKCHYLGSNELKQFADETNISDDRFFFLLRPRFDNSWNLGFARNFALLYSKRLKLEAALFMDDDIEISNLSLINDLFAKLNKFKFSGANVCKMSDHSILDHIGKDLGMDNDKMLSGGFLAYNPQLVNHFFLNIYNEDWIWLHLQLYGQNYIQTGEVYQAIFDPYHNYQNKIMFQEHGEIVIDGILDIFSKCGEFTKLENIEFWQNILRERFEYRAFLNSKIDRNKQLTYWEIVTYIEKYSLFQAEDFSKLFTEYFSNLRLFQTVYQFL